MGWIGNLLFFLTVVIGYFIYFNTYIISPKALHD
jgi:hypothetical protein